MLATAFKEVTMIASTHSLSLSSLLSKVLHFLLSIISKFDHDFLHWQISSLVCSPEKPHDIAFTSTVLKRVQRLRVS